MPVNPDFIAYHRSLANEFKANKDQIRNLIGDAHWPSDGGHKEAILRRVLQNKLPDTFRVGTGFFSDAVQPSSQIDILITDAGKPTLFRNGDFVVVTPDCVKAIIEVKTKLIGPKKIKEALENLIENVRRVRQINPHCWAGLFVYEGPHINNNEQFVRQSQTNSRNTLESLQNLAKQDPLKAINCVTFGTHNFVRFWSGIPKNFPGRLQQPGWQSYLFNTDRSRGLSPAYFVGNLVMHLTAPEDSELRRVWFPIQDENGKEDYCLDFIEMGQNQINTYGQNV